MSGFLLRRLAGARRATLERLARPLGAACLLVTSGLLFSGSLARAERFFEIEHIASQGRIVAVEIAELDGDGRADLLVVALLGFPPEEERIARVYLQKPDGSLPAEPDHTVQLPRWSAVYDVADLKKSPGQELVLLRPDGVTLLSLADASGRSWHLPVSGPTAFGMADDERGLSPYHLVERNFGPEPWLLVPQIGQLLALSPGGEVRARLETPRRANYFVAPHARFVSVESDLQVFVDAPKLCVGDVDGDGRADAVLATRHEIWVYLRKKDGSLPSAPDRKLALHLLTPRDHVRGSGGVASMAKDIDGDGRLDLLVTHVGGDFTHSSSTTYVHMNRGGGWKLDEPDRVFRSENSLGVDALLDLNGDGCSELLRMNLRFSLLEVVEFLLTRDLDIQVSIHRYRGDRGFEEEPWVEKQIEVPISFETFRSAGFLPAAGVDLNADGLPDFVFSGGGSAIEVFLGGGEKPLDGKAFRQEIRTAGAIRFGDVDGDGLLDFAIFDPHDFHAPVRVGRNLGRLPGTPPSLRKPVGNAGS